jgi:hypothetical protein
MVVTCFLIIWQSSFAKLRIQHPSQVDLSVLVIGYQWQTSIIRCFRPFSPLCIGWRKQWLLAMPISGSLSTSTRFWTFWPGSPVCPNCKFTIWRTHSCLGVAANTRTIACCVCNVIDRLLPYISRRTIITDQEVFIVPRKAPVCKLWPATANMCCVLPNKLCIVSNTFTTLVSSSISIGDLHWLLSGIDKFTWN